MNTELSTLNTECGCTIVHTFFVQSMIKERRNDVFKSNLLILLYISIYWYTVATFTDHFLCSTFRKN